MKRSIATTTSDRAEVDMTPMLDVVFILLIFFVVTASFVSERVLGLHLPENSPPVEEENASVLIQVNEHNEIFIDERRVDGQAIASLVAQKLSENPEIHFIVRAHELSLTNTYVQVADAIKRGKGGQASLIAYTD